MKTLRVFIEPLESRIAPAALNFADHFPRVFGTPGSNVIITDLAAMPDGSVVMVGAFFGTVDFDPGSGTTTRTPPPPTNPNSPLDTFGDAFIARYSTTGALLWVSQFGGAEFDQALSVAVDATGDVVAAGTFFSTGAKLNGSGSSSWLGVSGADIFVVKLDGATGAAKGGFGNGGVTLWGGTNADGPSSTDGKLGLTVDVAGNIYVAGDFRSTNAGFNGLGTMTTHAAGATNAFVFKLNGGSGGPDTSFGGDGVVTFGGSTQDSALDVVASPDGSQVFVAGGFFSTNAGIDGLGTIASAATGGVNGFVLGLTSGGSAIGGFGRGGVMTFGGTVGDTAEALAFSGTTLMVGGIFRGTNAVFNGAGTTYPALGSSSDVFLAQIDPATGALTANATAFTTFGGTTNEIPNTLSLEADATGAVFFTVSGSGDVGFNGAHSIQPTGSGTFYVGKLKSVADGGGPDLGFNTKGYLPFSVNSDQHLDSSHLAVGSATQIYLAGRNFNNVDLDPYSGVVQATGTGAFLISINPNVPLTPIDRSHPLLLLDANGEQVSVTLTGDGYGEYTLNGGVANNADLDTIMLFDTDSTTTLTIAMVDAAALGTTVKRIITTGTAQSISTITLGDDVELGSGVNDATPDLVVTGFAGLLKLDEVRAHTKIVVGSGLSIADANRSFTRVIMLEVLGPGVSIRADDADGSASTLLGGGALGIEVQRWKHPGFIGTTGRLEIRATGDDFGASTEVDKLNTSGRPQDATLFLNITKGGILDSTHFVRGAITELRATGMNTGVFIEAASIEEFTFEIGNLVDQKGDFAGTLRLTDPAPTAKTALTFADIEGEFTGTIDSTSDVLKVEVGGAFKGTIRARSIGAITTTNFDGATTNEGSVALDDPLTKNLIATEGGIGLLKPTKGGVAHYDIQAAKGDFAGITVKATDPLVAGIDDTAVVARSIGDLNVSLKTGTGGAVFGIRDSGFFTTGTGFTAKDDGSIGKVIVSLVNVAAATAATGLQSVTLDAVVTGNEFAALIGPHGASTLNEIDQISVTISGIPGTLAGLRGVLAEADFIGPTKIKLTAAATGSGAKVTGITNSAFTAHAVGPTAAKSAYIAPILVTLNGAAGANDYLGIDNSAFTADVSNGLGTIADVIVDINKAVGKAGGIFFSRFTADQFFDFAVNVEGGASSTVGYGIDDSIFDATGGFATGKQASSIESVRVSVTGGAGGTGLYGITSSTFSSAASYIGPVDVKLKGAGALAVIAGLEDVAFFTATGITSVKVAATGGGSGLVATGIENIQATGAFLGPVTVALGISGEDFATATGIGGDVQFLSTGPLGKLSVAVKATGSGTGTVFGLNAAPGNIIFSGSKLAGATVVASGGPDHTQSIEHAAGQRVLFTANAGDLGAFKATTTVNSAGGSSARGVEGLTLRALAGKVGKVTLDGKVTDVQGDDVLIGAGAGFGGINVTSAEKSKGILMNSFITAGQQLAPAGTLAQQKAQYAAAKLGSTTISGNLIGTQIIGAADVSAVVVGTGTGGNLSTSLILAGVKLGADALLGGTGGNADTYFKWGDIAGVTVRGALVRATIAAGVDSVDGVYGNAGDIAATTTTPELALLAGKIGAIVAGAASVFTPTAPYSTPAALAHDFVIEAKTIKSLAIGKVKAKTTFTAPFFLDATTGTTGSADTNDILVRKL